MRPRNALIFIALAATVLLAGWQFRAMLQREIERSGYLEYSTLRADPRGARALYESLAVLPGYEVSRNTLNLSLFPTGPDKTLYILGATPGPDARALVERLDEFVTGGGRLVVALAPLSNLAERSHEDTPDERNETEGAEDLPAATPDNGTNSNTEISDVDVTPPQLEGLPPVEASPLPSPTPDAENPLMPDVPVVEEPPVPSEKENDTDSEDTGASSSRQEKVTLDVEDVWGFEIDHKGFGWRKSEFEAERTIDAAELPPAITLRSTWCFTGLQDEWTTLYARNALPVVISRPRGDGSIVLVADAYPFSNEAMIQDRNAAFLLWTAGPNRRLVFDEWGKNVSDDPRIIHLILRYRLHGFLIAGVLLGLLFVWKSGYTLRPRHTEGRENAQAETLLLSEAHGGLKNLLMHHLRPSAALAAAFREWERSQQQDTRIDDSLRSRLRELLVLEEGPEPDQADVLNRFRQAQGLLRERGLIRD